MEGNTEKVKLTLEEMKQSARYQSCYAYKMAIAFIYRKK